MCSHARATILVVSLSLGATMPLDAQDRMPPIPADRLTDAQRRLEIDRRLAAIRTELSRRG